MTDELRRAMGDAAVAAAKAVDYVGAGTVEFIVDGAAFPDPSAFWFMEMNTRLQVEHPVTEAVTGLDLVALQLAVAEGAALPFPQDDLSLDGHAFEARLYAEDPSAGFLPAIGRLNGLSFGGGARIDTGVREGDRITPHYDPMIAKLTSHGPDRVSALRLLERALEGTAIQGVKTNRDFLIRLARDAEFAAGRMDTGLIARRGEVLVARPEPEALHWAMAALGALKRTGEDAGDPFQTFGNYRHFGAARQVVTFDDAVAITVETTGDTSNIETPLGPITVTYSTWSGDRLTLTAEGQKCTALVLRDNSDVQVDRQGTATTFRLAETGGGEAESADDIAAPLTGRVVKVIAMAGATVEKDAPLLIVEAMKMEHTLRAPRDGVVAAVNATEGQQVDQGAILIAMEAEDDG